VDVGDAKALKTKFAHSSWEGDEQKGTNQASEETILQLAALNDAYLRKQGFIFLICATGKSAQEMVQAMQLRMPNDVATEVRLLFVIYIHS
jgi:2-oxo-4-hydroxy-4-carboxy-5-ureidoimidazoline decarboxylase